MRLDELTDVTEDELAMAMDMYEPGDHEEGLELALDADADAPDAPARRRTLKPAPGQVIVLRNSILPYYVNADDTPMLGMNSQPMMKPQRVIDDEERSNVLAVIARVGDDDLAGNRTAWFKAGDEVVIAPHVFTEIVIAGGADGTVWLGPFAGVKGLFEYEDDELGAERVE